MRSCACGRRSTHNNNNNSTHSATPTEAQSRVSVSVSGSVKYPTAPEHCLLVIFAAPLHVSY